MRIITTRRFLKKIIIFLLIIILLFLFKTNVFASEISNYNMTIKYDDTLKSNIDLNETRLNNLHTYLGTINSFGSSPFPTHRLSSGDYVLIISNISNASIWYVTLQNVNSQYTGNPKFYSHIYNNNSYYEFGSTNVMYIILQINWNGNNVSSHSTYTQGSGGFGEGNRNYINICNPVATDCTFEITNRYYDTYFLNSSRSLPFVDYSTISSGNAGIQIPVKSGNNVYNVGDTINMKSFFDNLYINAELEISYELVKQNGYYDLTLYANNYTGETIQDGKGVQIIDTSTGQQTFISPDVNGLPNTSMTIQVYTSKTYKYQIITNEYEVLYEEIINVPNVEYDNFSIVINSIDKENNRINYSYVNNGNTTNFKCYHQIQNGFTLQDRNCTNVDNNYTISLSQNKNVNFIIRDSANNIIFEDTRNFVMNVGSPFIEFQENYEYNLLNIKILFNRFNTTDYIAKYQINNEAIVTITPTQEQTTYNDVFSYIVYNITENSVIKAFIYDTSNNLIASSTFNVTYAFVEKNKLDTTNFNDLFKNLSFSNISSELLNYISNIGNTIINTKLGTIIFTTFIISLLGLVIKLIRR